MCDEENEELSVWSNDGYPCGNTCENYKVPCGVMLPMVLVWSPHCVCKKGFAKLPNGKCVPLEEPECQELWKPSTGKSILDKKHWFNVLFFTKFNQSRKTF